jgi:tRNA A-37 threonylcarbamoyl transferase component Bud32/tetratricopeptide (TPR) repeat protein
MTPDNYAAKEGAPHALYVENQILDNRYRVLSLLGRGGMGVVYKVEQIFLAKTMALKTIDSASQSEILVRRFQAEAKAVIAVNHPNIIAVHDFGVFDDGTPFLAMEYVEGQTFSQLIQSRTLTLNDALAYFIQVCFGLAHAHRSGIVHRDIKPGNLMIVANAKPGADGSVKILDFGIAKLTQHEGGEIQALTRTGEIFGSPIYMSPEQCVGGNVDGRSDVYSLGCVIFEALTGAPPFVGENALSTMMMHQSNDIPSLKEASLGTDFPPALERVVHKMLAKSPASRYQDLALAAHDLAAIQQGEPETVSVKALPVATAARKPAGKASTITMKRSSFALSFACTALMSVTASFLLTKVWLSVYRTAPEVTHVQERPVAFPSAQSGQAGDESYDFNLEIKRRLNIFDGNGVTNNSLKLFENYEDAQSLQVANEIDAEDLTEKGISYLAKSRLINLQIRRADIRNVDVIVRQKYLQTLDLRGTLISDSEIPKLLQLKMLRVLNLTGSRITERGLRSLLASKSLVQLILDERCYTKSWLNEFRRKMPQCRTPYGDNPSPLERLEQKLADKSEFAKHLAMYQMCRAASPDLSMTANCLVRMADDKNGSPTDYRKYMEEAKRIVDRNGDEAEQAVIYRNLAKFETANKNYLRAMELSDRMIQILPNNVMHNHPDFFIQIMELVNHAQQFNDLKRMEQYSDVGIRYGEIFKSSAGDFLADFYLVKGRALSLQKKPSEALPVLMKLVVLTNGVEAGSGYYNNMAGKITYAHCLPVPATRKSIYDECIKSIESHKFPNLWDLAGHYCDACDQMNVIYGAEGNTKQQIVYLEKQLDALEHHMGSLISGNITHLRITATSRRLQKLYLQAHRQEDARKLSAKYHI